MEFHRLSNNLSAFDMRMHQNILMFNFFYDYRGQTNRDNPIPTCPCSLCMICLTGRAFSILLSRSSKKFAPRSVIIHDSTEFPNRCIKIGSVYFECPMISIIYAVFKKFRHRFDCCHPCSAEKML